MLLGTLSHYRLDTVYLQPDPNMASFFRRLSTSSNKTPDDTTISCGEPSAASTELDTRILGARDYKLGISTEDSKERRFSVASTIVDQISRDEPSVGVSSTSSPEG